MSMLRFMCAVIAASGSLTVAAAERPNILFIFTDDQSYKTIRCYPESWKWVRTPNIDALAKSGVRFEQAYLGAWCMPSRATLLTGRLPHGIESMRMAGEYPGSTYDPQQSPFWPRVFREQGYHTAQIGKWHTGTDSGFGRDWDTQIVWNRPKHPENAGNYYAKQRLAFNGVERVVDGYSTENYTKWACEYIRGEGRDEAKPWYLWLCYGGVHGPSHPAPQHEGAYAKVPVTPPVDIFPPRPGKPAYLDKTQAWSRGPNGVPVMGKSGEKFGDDSSQNARTYADWVRQVNECVLSLDEGVGELLKTLQETGQLENTLVVFTADQGFGMGEHGFRTKLAPYDGTMRSPLIFSQPSTIPAGQVCRQPAGSQDLVVTFFARAGIELPWTMHGRDLSPLLSNPQAAWNHPLLYEHMGHDYGRDTATAIKENKAVHSDVPFWVALRKGRYKYVRNLIEAEIEELYDQTADPDELTNLADKPEHARRLQELRQLTVAELRRTEAPFVELLPKTAAELGASSAAIQPANSHIVLIGGFDSDPTVAQLSGTAPRGVGNSGMFQLRNDLRSRMISAEYFNWNGTPPGQINTEDAPGPVAIVEHIRLRCREQPKMQLSLVGNSWGGHTACEVCRLLAEQEPAIPVEFVVFLDPSSAGRPNSQRPEQLSANVQRAVQYASRSAVVWTAWKDEPRVEQINLADAKAGFLRAGGPPYGAFFSPNSHIGAEWDPLIHSDIIRRLSVAR